MSIKASTPANTDTDPLDFTEKHRLLKLRLVPIRGVQRELEKKLGSGAFEDRAVAPLPAPPMSSAASVNDSTTDVNVGFHGTKREPGEFYIRSNNSWKDRFRGRSGSGSRPQDLKEMEEVAGIIAGCKDDMKAIWEDAVIQKMLKKRKYRLEDSPGL